MPPHHQPPIVTTEAFPRNEATRYPIRDRCRHVASRYDKLAADDLAFIKLASMRLAVR
jgi:hypothetical protein